LYKYQKNREKYFQNKKNNKNGNNIIRKITSQNVGVVLNYLIYLTVIMHIFNLYITTEKIV